MNNEPKPNVCGALINANGLWCANSKPCQLHNEDGSWKRPMDSIQPVKKKCPACSQPRNVNAKHDEMCCKLLSTVRKTAEDTCSVCKTKLSCESHDPLIQCGVHCTYRNSQPPEPIPEWEKEFDKRFCYSKTGGEHFKSHSPLVHEVIAFIKTVEREAERRGRDRGFIETCTDHEAIRSKARAEERKRIAAIVNSMPSEVIDGVVMFRFERLWDSLTNDKSEVPRHLCGCRKDQVEEGHRGYHI